MTSPSIGTDTVLLFQEDESQRLDLSQLTGLLTRAISSRFGDATLVLHLVNEEHVDALPKSQRGGSVVHETLALPSNFRPTLEKVIQERRSRYAHIYLDPAPKGPSRRALLNSGLVDGMIVVTEEPMAEDRLIRHGRMSRELGLRWALITEIRRRATRRPEQPLPLREIRRTFERIHRRSDRSESAPRELAESLVLVDLCRLPCPRDSMSPVLSEDALGRWARAATRRRVGLALGGGGAWGYVHLVLLRKLIEEKIPIDIITGSSAGALIGAYYGAAGPRGLDRYYHRHKEMLGFARANVASSAWIERMMEDDLGNPLLEDLDVLFLPVAVNLSEGETTTFISGSLSTSTRASCSMPGFFGTTALDGKIFVDGALAHNVPAALAEAAGAGLLVTCNALPRPKTMTEIINKEGSVWLKALTTLTPLGRALTLFDALGMLCYKAGYYQSLATFESLGRSRALRVSYRHEAKQPWPLMRSFGFENAQRIIDDAERNEELQARIKDTVDKWRELSRPRTPSPESLEPSI